MRQGLDPLRVTLVDDSMLFRKGLAALLTDAGVEIAGVAATPDEAMVRIEADRPDVVVMDIRMAPTFTNEGLQVARELKARDPDLGVLLLSAHVEVASAASLFDEHSGGVGRVIHDHDHQGPARGKSLVRP